VAQGPSDLRKTDVQHALLVKEFAAWVKQVILFGKLICIELTVRKDDENCTVAIEGLKEEGVDIFGAHAAHFCFQGGLTGPKAFDPQQLAEHVAMSAWEHAAQHVRLQSKLDECRQHLAMAEAANIAFTSARHGAEFRKRCASVAGAATLAAAAAQSAAVAANAVAKAVPDQEPTVGYRIALTKPLCKAFGTTPGELFSEGSAIQNELGRRCEVKAVGSYPVPNPTRSAELDSEMEAVIIVQNSGPALSVSEIKGAVKRLVKRTIEEGVAGVVANLLVTQ